METQLGVSVPQVALESASNRRLELQRLGVREACTDVRTAGRRV